MNIRVSLLLFLGLCGAVSASTCVTTSDGNSFTQTGICGHTFTVNKGTMANSQTIWVDEYRNGALYSTGVYWVQTTSSGTLNYNLDLPNSTGTPPTSSGYYNLYAPSGGGTTTVVYKNRATGEVMLQITDTRTIVTGSGDNINHATFDTQTFYCQGGIPAQNSGRVPVSISTNGQKAHTFVLKENGAVVQSWTAPANGQTFAYTGLVSLPSAKITDTVTMSVDGVTVQTWGAGTSAWPMPTEQDGLNHDTSSFYLTVNDNKPGPTPTPTPTATQTNQGTSQVTGTAPDGTTVTQTSVNNGSTTISGTANGATVQDLYEAVKDGTTDALNSQVKSVAGQPTIADAPNDDASWNDKVTTLQNSATTISNGITSRSSSVSSASSTMAAAIANIKSGTRLPTVSAGNWNFMIPLTVHGTVTNVDLSPYSTLFTWIRRVLSMIVAVAFFLITLKLINKAFAAAGT